MAGMPTANIGWQKVTPFFRVYIRKTPKGENSYYVVIDESGKEFVPDWCSRTRLQAQMHLDRLAKRTEKVERRA